MRLSPGSIFFAIVSIGLPFAVTIGWNVGDSPLPRPSVAPEQAGGAGGLGSAPARDTGARPAADELSPTSTRSAWSVASTSPTRASQRSTPRPSRTATRPATPRATVPPTVSPTTRVTEPSAVPPTPTLSGAPDTTATVLRERR